VRITQDKGETADEAVNQYFAQHPETLAATSS
jgi:hypothetical protein